MNRSREFDAIVIGGGPVGAIAARGIARQGMDVALVEEHSAVGLPQHCAGLISVDGLDKIGVEASDKFILNRIRGVTIFSPSGEKLTVERRHEQAFVVDRISLDRELVSEAVKSGSHLMLNTRAKSIRLLDSGAIVDTENRQSGNRKSLELTSRLAISCEGASPRLTGQVGLNTPNPSMRLSAVQFEMSHVELERDDLAEIHLGRGLAPGFFAWIIPTSNDAARVGMASRASGVHANLKNFVEHYRPTFSEFRNARIEKVFGGMVLTGGPIPRTSLRRFLAVGDCAGQTKPTTGGGVVTGGICARIASRVAAGSLSIDDPSESLLREYDRQWQMAIGRELLAMSRLRWLLNIMPDRWLDRLVRWARRSHLLRLIEEKGDIDMQSQLMKAIIRDPRLVLTLLLSTIGITWDEC